MTRDLDAMRAACEAGYVSTADYVKEKGMSEHLKLEKIASALTHELVRQGRIVESGFAGYRSIVMDKSAPDIQVNECRLAFFAGAKHLFDSMMHILDPGEEPTEADLQRMSQIASELEQFGADFVRKHFPTKGQG